MRSIAVFMAVFATLPLALVFPFVGVLIWAWLAFMNPHREAFGLAHDFAFNFYVAVVTLGAWIVSREPKRLPNSILPILVIAFAIMFSITTYFALDREYSFPLWDRHIRTIALVLIVMAMANSKVRIQAFLWMIVISIGYYAVKGGGYVALTGSIGNINGPAGSMIEDNNHLSLAIVATIPILHYLRTTSSNPVVKLGCLIVLCISIVCVVGTLSRGGFIGLMVVSVAFVLFSRPRLAGLLVPVTLASGIYLLAPQVWFDRIGTIGAFQSDQSVNERFAAWRTSWNLATSRPLLGGGFSAIESSKVDFRYNKVDWKSVATEQKQRARAAHSLYFQVLGDHGFVGLLLWLGMAVAGIVNAVQISAQARGQPQLAWAGNLARMLLVSYTSFLAAGCFLSMAYYDVFLCLLALSAPLREIVSQKAAIANDLVSEDPMQVPVWQAKNGAERAR